MKGMNAETRAYVFQFPSNGKVYLDELDKYSTAAISEVFQFPSNGKVYLDSFTH